MASSTGVKSTSALRSWTSPWILPGQSTEVISTEVINTLPKSKMETQRGPYKDHTVLLKGNYMGFHVGLGECKFARFHEALYNGISCSSRKKTKSLQPLTWGPRRQKTLETWLHMLLQSCACHCPFRRSVPATGSLFDYRGLRLGDHVLAQKRERPRLMNRQCFRDLRGQDKGSVGKLQ